MKNYNIFLLILIGLVFSISCSNDDDSNENNDIIIGEWKVIQKYESDILVDLPIILECIFTTYTSDNRVYSSMISSNNLPSDCTTPNFEFGKKWTKIDNDQYRIGFPQEQDQGQIHTFYKDGVNLIEEKPDGITKLVYEPYEQ